MKANYKIHISVRPIQFHRDVKIFFLHTNMYANLSKTDKFDKSEITRTTITTTTIKSFLRPLLQYMLAVKNPDLRFRPSVRQIEMDSLELSEL